MQLGIKAPKEEPLLYL